MADTTVKIDSQSRHRFAAVAAAQGKSVRAYLAELAIEEENQLALGREFGVLPASASTRRAA
ncbi:antitoxin MazE7 [Streptomyces sp. NPDC006463]|uniref:antitoxin MazE7 n=1 Tax=Streptomyces sp. NPDC006463 TaxID=3364746 RepID=UPI0036758E89